MFDDVVLDMIDKYEFFVVTIQSHVWRIDILLRTYYSMI